MNRSILPPLCVLAATGTLFLSTILNVPDSAPESGQPAGSGIAVLTKPLSASESSAPAPESTPIADDSTPASSSEKSNPVAQLPARATGKKSENTKKDSEAETGPQLHTTIGSVEIFPASNDWNQRIDDLPVHRHSSVWLRSIGIDKGLHPDFGTVWRGAPNGIPYVVVRPDQPKVPVAFQYADESDPGPYPIPPDAPIEGGPDAPLDSDRHVIMVDPQSKRLYELFQVIRDPIVGWRAGSGAIFDLSRNHHRPLGWTSADAAGLPIFPGLVRYEEVAAGEIRHALRFTVARTQRAYIFPARHFASRSNDPNLPPMGLRVRLKADYDISKFPPSARVILTALKRYGMLLADNGSDWFISGAPNPRWSDSELATLKQIKGRDLECVHTGELTR
jgi:hypothetical protein